VKRAIRGFAEFSFAVGRTSAIDHYGSSERGESRRLDESGAPRATLSESSLVLADRGPP
jgi:hypothetical protein